MYVAPLKAQGEGEAMTVDVTDRSWPDDRDEPKTYVCSFCGPQPESPCPVCYPRDEDGELIEEGENNE